MIPQSTVYLDLIHLNRNGMSASKSAYLITPFYSLFKTELNCLLVFVHNRSLDFDADQDYCR